MFHVPILRLRLGNMLLLLLLLSCVPHWTCVTRRFSFFAYQLTLISLSSWMKASGKETANLCALIVAVAAAAASSDVGGDGLFIWMGFWWGRTARLFVSSLLTLALCCAVLAGERHTWHYRQISKGRFHHKQASSVFVDGWSGVDEEEEGAGRGLA